MNKKIILVFISIYFTAFCFATDIYRNGRIGDCNDWITEINQDEVMLYTDFDKYDRDYYPQFMYSNGKFYYEGKLRFIDLRDKKSLDIPNCKTERYLVLKNNDIVLYFKNNQKAEMESFNPWLKGFEEGCYCLITETTSTSTIKTSSVLNEKGRLYSGSNLLQKAVENVSDANFFQLANPWIEGNIDYGIGEYFELSGEGVLNDYIYISIGYVDITKPYLYEQNSRPSAFDVYIDDTYWKTISLEDTPDPQRFEFSDATNIKKDSSIRFVIKDVYKGTKYKDTCVNFIFFAKKSTTGYIE